jgi:hypothetical protein
VLIPDAFNLSRIDMSSSFCSHDERYLELGQSILVMVAIQAPRISLLGELLWELITDENNIMKRRTRK